MFAIVNFPPQVYYSHHTHARQPIRRVPARVGVRRHRTMNCLLRLPLVVLKLVALFALLAFVIAYVKATMCSVYARPPPAIRTLFRD